MKRVLSYLRIAGLCSTLGASTAWGAIYGTLSNFDVYNETHTDAYGAELELEGLHQGDVYYTFPAHYSSKSISEYVDGANFGVRIKYSGYNFNNSGYLAPTVGQSTNGHSCVNLPGCEHFGFALGAAQPTATRYFWLDQNGQRIDNAPMAVPSPTWSYYPPANGGNPVLRAEVEVPKPENEVQKPDSIWMKVYKTEIDRPVDLMELMSDDPVLDADVVETETEWELLEGGKVSGVEDKVGHGKKGVIRRYEYFAYTGLYDNEHEPISLFQTQNLAEPPVDELGQFIAANMVAANLVPFVGDANSDELIDGADASIIYTNWGNGHPGDDSADLNRDGTVDGADIGKVFGGWTGDSQAAAVPEAASFGLAALGIAGLMTARRSSATRGPRS